jgi:hypothetical protein|tara:strand:+ start:850 stop:1200 length:351 start_codon:yes stop_codon:yes gene_type:complete
MNSDIVEDGLSGIADAVREAFQPQRIGDDRNDGVADVLADIATSLASISSAIHPHGAGAKDDFGGYVASLTESCMSISSGLNAIAIAIENVAEAIGQHQAMDAEPKLSELHAPREE